MAPARLRLCNTSSVSWVKSPTSVGIGPAIWRRSRILKPEIPLRNSPISDGMAVAIVVFRKSKRRTRLSVVQLIPNFRLSEQKSHMVTPGNPEQSYSLHNAKTCSGWSGTHCPRPRTKNRARKRGPATPSWVICFVGEGRWHDFRRKNWALEKRLVSNSKNNGTWFGITCHNWKSSLVLFQKTRCQTPESQSTWLASAWRRLSNPVGAIGTTPIWEKRLVLLEHFLSSETEMARSQQSNRWCWDQLPGDWTSRRWLRLWGFYMWAKSHLRSWADRFENEYPESEHFLMNSANHHRNTSL